MANLARLLTDTAAKHPDQPAVRLGDQTLTYRELDDAASRCAAMLRAADIAPGDRVGVMLPNVPEFPILYYGTLRAGAIVVPMNVLLKEREVAFYLGDSGAKVLFAWTDSAAAAQAGAAAVGARCVLVEPDTFAKALAEAEPMRNDADTDGVDTAVLLYTSGTTGTPKGAELTHDSLYENARVSSETVFELTDDDVVLGALPLFHTFGQTCALNASCYAGALLSMLPRFYAADGLETIARDHVTVFEGVPTMFNAFLHYPDASSYDTSSLRVCCSGGSAMPGEILKGFEKAFGCTILEGYGLSETSPVASFNHPHSTRRIGSIGTPIQGVQMKIAGDDGVELPDGEVGEIWIRGHNVMKGYWNRPVETSEVMLDGWLATGDLAQRDADGLYFIVDRKKDIIIRGGYNVYPREIEEVLYEHPKVREAAVVAVPDEALGQEVGATVVVNEGETLDPDELQAFVKDRVAAYKYPRFIWIVDELPKGPTGKILRREIRVPG